ncbi:MAG: tetratricopeptide repeat protein [Chitinophagales bacterium]|nr:tetratricopeptide repeat protein [Chitinophagales bacterium]
MKKMYLPTFLLGLILSVSVANAQNCPIGDEKEAAKNYSLYKEYFKQGAFDRALPFWRESYFKSPGYRKSIFVDGPDIYADLISNTENGELRERYIDTLMAIYDKRIQCWGDKGYVLTLKGSDLAKFRPTQYLEAKNILQEAINIDQTDSKYYGIATYFNLLINLKDDPKAGVSNEFIKSEYKKLVAICDANIQAGKNADAYAQTKASMTYNLEEYVLPKRFAEGAQWHTWSTQTKIDSVKQWVASDNSTPNIEDILSNISRDTALSNSDIRYELDKLMFERNPSAIRANNLGAHFYEIKQFDAAVPYFEKAIDLTEDAKGKANLLLALGDTYRNLDKFPEARDVARKAISLDSASAKPYYFIGVLYLSSGKKCGPGTGFDSQRVIWPAFDYFNKAKQLDSTYTEIVDGLMNDYKKYLPTRSEIAAKGLKVGATYTVPCWIQEETTILSKD